MRKLGKIPLNIFVTTLIFGLSQLGIDIGSASSESLNSLKPVGNFGSGYIYTFPSIRQCEVNDGVAVVKNASRSSIKIIAIRAAFSSAEDTKNVYLIYAFKAGSTRGEVSASSDVQGLQNGKLLGSAINARLEPITKSHLWYVLVARINLLKNANSKWSILGLQVTYRIGNAVLRTRFRQRIDLPPTQGCDSKSL